MKIIFSPMRREDRVDLAVAGDTLTIAGEDFDFSPIPEGATLPREAVACDWIAGDVERDAGGELKVPLILPHGASAPQATLYPVPVTVATDGPVTLPPYEAEEEETEA